METYALKKNQNYAIHLMFSLTFACELGVGEVSMIRKPILAHKIQAVFLEHPHLLHKILLTKILNILNLRKFEITQFEKSSACEI